MTASTREFRRKNYRRIRIVMEAVRDGCNDCPDRGMLCQRHIEEMGDLLANPKKWLPVWEQRIFGSTEEAAS